MLPQFILLISLLADVQSYSSHLLPRAKQVQSHSLFLEKSDYDSLTSSQPVYYNDYKASQNKKEEVNSQTTDYYDQGTLSSHQDYDGQISKERNAENLGYYGLEYYQEQFPNSFYYQWYANLLGQQDSDNLDFAGTNDLYSDDESLGYEWNYYDYQSQEQKVNNQDVVGLNKQTEGEESTSYQVVDGYYDEKKKSEIGNEYGSNYYYDPKVQELLQKTRRHQSREQLSKNGEKSLRNLNKKIKKNRNTKRASQE